MNIYEFQLLTHQQKCEVAFREGIYISARAKGELSYNLYSISSFYVEIAFHLLDNYLDNVLVFNSSRLLEPYLEEISITL